MSKIVLKQKNGDEAEIDLVGATLTKLLLSENNLIKYPLKKEDPRKGYPSALLFPFPNRIKDGTYTFNEKEYNLFINEVENHNAIHGLIAFETFEVVKQTASRVKLKYSYSGENPGYPFEYDFFIEYILRENQLDLVIDVFNTGEGEMPCGFGWHPYFGFNGESISGMTVKAPKSNKVELSDRVIPTGESTPDKGGLIPLKNTILDNIFFLDESTKVGISEIELRYQKMKLIVAQKTGKQKLNHFILYAPASRDCLAIEPQSCNTNAFNNLDGLIIIKPKKKVKFEISVKLEL